MMLLKLVTNYIHVVVMDEVEVCAICLAEYKENDMVSELTCSHMFHTDCVAKWIGSSFRRATCPICRTIIT